MKSFGVRLAAGVVTIVFGAYAAALAQKDKQNGSNSWTAQAPSLGEPAAPIADMSEDSWLSQPASGSENALSQAAQAFSQNPVVLVQHTDESPTREPAPKFDPSNLPASLGSPEAAPETAVADWTLPASTDAESVETNESPSITFPAETPVLQAAPPMDQAPMATALPALDLAEGPDADYYPTHEAPSAPEPITGAPEPLTASPANAVPSNMLRGMPDGMNALRDVQPAPQHDLQPQAAVATGNMAQNAPGFGQPMSSFDQPEAAMPAHDPSAPAYGHGAPTSGYDPPPAAQQRPIEGYNAAAPSYGAPQQYPGNAPERMASLPNPNNRIPQGYQPERFEQPSGAIAIDPAAVIDAPGDRRLEGIQSPSVVIHKRAPAQVKVGKPASFVIHVQNVGTAEALDVKVHDRVPAGMRLVDAVPTPVQQGNLLMWELGTMPAGDERTVTMQLVPETEGELGSVARVTFEAAASVRTISTRPELKIVQKAPEKVLIGQQLEIELEVSNPGTGEATNVSLQEDVPEGLEHPKGRQLDNLIGTLAPGEVRHQVLRLRAVSPGIIQNQIRLVSDDGLTAEHAINVEVISPDLKVELSGPSRRFLERQATYQLDVANIGTADATNIEISVQLDRGFTFVSTDFEGQYDPSRHAVFWSLAQLPAGGGGKVPLTLLPVEEGERALVIDARADLGVIAKSERVVSVEGFAELSFQISNPGGPIELGAETSYEITVRNDGSKTDSNVMVQLLLPPSLELISADGDAGTDGRGLVQFQPRPQLSPGTEMKHRIRVRGVAPGTHIVKAIVVSDQATTPVTKEESTLVYADR